MTDLITDHGFDPVVALVATTDLTVSQLLALRRGDLYLPALLTLSTSGSGRRVVHLTRDAQAVLAHLSRCLYDPAALLVREVDGKAPTSDALLQAIADHLALNRTPGDSPALAPYLRRLRRALRQGLRAA